MQDVLILALKGLAGGALVVAFALLSESLSPKRFAGLLGGAPAIALVGLTIVLLDKGGAEARRNALGMIAGSAGMIAYAATAIPLLRRMHAWRAAAASLTAWATVAAAVAVPVMLA